MTSPHALVEKTSITTATTMAASLCLSVALWASPYTPAFASEIFDSPGLIVVTGADEASLNDAIDAAISDGNCSDGCVIDVRATGDLSINNTLNKIAGFDHPIWLVGDTDNTTIINANDHQHLFVDNNDGGFFALQRITLSNGQVKGGEGTKGAGGGLGAGGAMFINNGLVILDRATVKDSNAYRGVSSGTAGKGAKVGNGSVRTGESGASGGRLNSGERHVPADAGAGTAGEGGDCYSGNKTRCGPQDKQHGGNGGFGGGGGSAGGGAGPSSGRMPWPILWCSRSSSGDRGVWAVWAASSKAISDAATLEAAPNAACPSRRFIWKPVISRQMAPSGVARVMSKLVKPSAAELSDRRTQLTISEGRVRCTRIAP